jgi:hypothetical protein
MKKSPNIWLYKIISIIFSIFLKIYLIICNLLIILIHIECLFEAIKNTKYCTKNKNKDESCDQNERASVLWRW